MTSRPFEAKADGAALSCVAMAWRAHESELRGYLRHPLSDLDPAGDVLRDVFVKAMRHGQGFCQLDNPRAWLFRVARNALIDRARAAHPTEPLPEGSAETAAPPPQAVGPVDALAECLARTLGELTADDAAILRACDLEGQTQRATWCPRPEPAGHQGACCIPGSACASGAPRPARCTSRRPAAWRGTWRSRRPD